MKNQHNSPTLWNNHTSLPNYFSKLQSPSYDDFELTDLVGLYTNTMHQDSQDVSCLLNATVNFSHATTLEDSFKKCRDNEKSDKDLITTLNTIAAAINKTPLNENPILLAAIRYCLEFIKKRMEELQTAQDRIYKLYNETDNQLKPLLKNPLITYRKQKLHL
ncbi:MAG TPA: hypothetical protein VJN02_00180 [Gammaproteobacteria bacterium]|nr:hypothetical protein [Gammaproteobacteria bacterium]